MNAPVDLNNNKSRPIQAMMNHVQQGRRSSTLMSVCCLILVVGVSICRFVPSEASKESRQTLVDYDYGGPSDPESTTPLPNVDDKSTDSPSTTPSPTPSPKPTSKPWRPKPKSTTPKAWPWDKKTTGKPGIPEKTTPHPWVKKTTGKPGIPEKTTPQPWVKKKQPSKCPLTTIPPRPPKPWYQKSIRSMKLKPSEAREEDQRPEYQTASDNPPRADFNPNPELANIENKYAPFADSRKPLIRKPSRSSSNPKMRTSLPKLPQPSRPPEFDEPGPGGEPNVNPENPWEGTRCVEKRVTVDTCSTSAILGYLTRNSCCDEMRIYCPPIFCSTKIYEVCKPDRKWCEPYMRDWNKYFDEIQLASRKKSASVTPHGSLGENEKKLLKDISNDDK